MKIIIQRVLSANVSINQKVQGKINHGFLLYVCFEKEDTLEQLHSCVKKVSNLRIFSDSEGKMNNNIKQNQGSILSISQFTLSWDGRKGNRPSFEKSMPPLEASEAYNIFNEALRSEGIKVETGIFGADMKVESINGGPVTFNLSF